MGKIRTYARRFRKRKTRIRETRVVEYLFN